MASRGSAVHGDDCSEAQASGCRREELARSAGLNTMATPYVPTCMQSPRPAVPPPSMNGYNAAPPYMPQPPPPPQQVYDTRPYQEVYGHDHGELSNNATSGVYGSYIPMDPAHLPMAYPSGQYFVPNHMMSPMYLRDYYVHPDNPHHPANPGASLAHPPPMNTPYTPPYLCTGGPVPYGICNPGLDFQYANQGMHVRQPRPHRASSDARPPPPRGRGSALRGNDVRQSRHSEGDRSSIAFNRNSNSINEDGSDFADADFNVQTSNEGDLQNQRTVMLDSMSGIPHHLEGPPIILGQAPQRYPSGNSYQPLRVVSVAENIPLGINASQAEEPVHNSSSSSPCDSSLIAVSCTANSITVSSPSMENNGSAVLNGLAVETCNGSHAIQSNDAATGYQPEALANNSFTTNNTAPYIPEDYVSPVHDGTLISSNSSHEFPAAVIEQTCTMSATESSTTYNMVPPSQVDSVPSNVPENHTNGYVTIESPEMMVQEAPAVYTATVTARHQPAHSNLEITEEIASLSISGGLDAIFTDLENVVSANHETPLAVPSCLEQTLEFTESDLGDLIPIFETRDSHNLSFNMTFGDLTRETIFQELEKCKASLPSNKPRFDESVCSQNISVSITSSDPVFDTSLTCVESNIHSALDFGTVSENEDLNIQRPEILTLENVTNKSLGKANMTSKSPPSFANDDLCTFPNSLPEENDMPISTTTVLPTVSVGGPTASAPETVATSVSGYSVTAEKPPLPLAPKKQSSMSSTGGRSAPVVGAGPFETPAPSAWGRNKNWQEQFQRPTGDCRAKSTAIISPTVRNGVMEGGDFTSINSGSVVSSISEAAAVSPVTHATVAAPPPPVDGTALKIGKTKVGGFLSEYKTNSSSVTLQPRGLTNKNYWCYANTVLQALTAVPQFVNLYNAMEQQVGSAITPHTMPISYSIISYLKEFSTMNTNAINLSARARKKTGQNIVNLPEVQLGDPFEPSSIQNMLLEKPGGQFMEGCQQDAEEMLSFLLNASHDEFNECLKLLSLEKEKSSGRKAPVAAVLPNGQTDESNDDWVTMGPKNKTCITRTTEFSHSPISEIFWGESRVIIKKGNSPVTNNLEPFITLPLDIQDDNVTSVKEALHQFVSKADVAGYTCTDTQEELTVSSQRLLEQLPQVMILQLKRFVYLKDGGLQKVIKDISLSIDLEISKDLISQQRRKKLSGEKVQYKLVSVIYHDGKDANKGHYVCNVYHPGYQCWLHYDDACVKPIVSTELQRCYAPRVPYLLFYRRADTFAENTAPLAIQPLVNRRRAKDKRNSSGDKVSCERRPDAEIRPSNDGPSAPESHSRVSSIDRKATSSERKVPEKSNNTLKGNKRQDKKQGKYKQAAKN